jgi:tetrahydromethanopterin S-methyltransferase subunit A
LPVPAFNTYNEKMDMLNAMEDSNIEPVNIAIITPEKYDPNYWPVQPGDYTVFNPTAFLAILILGDSRIVDRSFFSSLGNIAVTGNLTTENIGIEYVVKNLISNPYIRHLAIIGVEITGHCPGNAIINLHKNGIDALHAIVAASGARPVLKNVLPQEITQFRKQISIHNFMDINDADALKDQINLLNSLHSVPYEQGLYVRLVNTIEAKPNKRLHLDREGYFIVLARKGKENPLYVEHYKNNGRLLHIIEGKDASTICSTIINMKLVSRMDHAAYLGRELAKAEYALSSNTRYIQDQAQGVVIGNKMSLS